MATKKTVPARRRPAAKKPTSKKKVVAKKAPVKKEGVSKMTMAEEYMDAHPGLARKDIIKHFQEKLDMTPAGSSTYYAILKKRLNYETAKKAAAKKPVSKKKVSKKRRVSKTIQLNEMM